MTNETLPGPEQQPLKNPSRWMRIWRTLTEPHTSIQDVTARQQAQLAAAIAFSLFFIILFGLVSSIIVRGSIQYVTISLAGLGLGLLICYFLIRSKLYRIGISMMVWLFAVSGYVSVLPGSENPVGGLVSSLLPAFILASILTPTWEFGLLVAINIFVLIPITIPGMSAAMKGTLIGTCVTISALLFTGVLFRNSLERQRLKDVNQVNEELKLSQALLEQRVEARTMDLQATTLKAEKQTRQLQTISDVARAIALITDQQKLLQEVCQLINERFGFYHAAVFLLDEEKQYAVLRATNSEGGRQMLAREHKLRIGGTGIVSYAITMNRARVALDVVDDAFFARNPDLPETRSEMALPLAVGERVFGALDLQSAEEHAFSEDDTGVMKTMADQVALAIENIRLLDETQRALTDAQNTYREYFASRWGQAGEENPIGYHHGAKQTAALEQPVRWPEVLSALKTGKTVQDFKEVSTVAVPVKVRDQVIGVLNIRANRPAQLFTEEDVAFMQSIAERVGLSLENARLFNAAQKRAAKERTIGGISTRIGESSNIDSILQVAAEVIGHALPGSEVVVQIQKSE